MDQDHDISNYRQGVVVACRRADGRWLMLRRAACLERAPLRVGFPGGEIEEGETQAQAAAREVMEEVGVVVEPLRCVWRHEWHETGWVLWGWLGDIVSGEVCANPAEVDEVLWLTLEEALGMEDGLPNNRHFFKAIVEALGE